MWKKDSVFCVVPGDRIRTCGWKSQRQICTHQRELSNRQSCEDGVGSLRKQQYVPDTCSVEQRMKDLLLTLVQIESEHSLDLNKPRTLARPSVEWFSTHKPILLAVGDEAQLCYIYFIVTPLMLK